MSRKTTADMLEELADEYSGESRAFHDFSIRVGEPLFRGWEEPEVCREARERAVELRLAEVTR